MSTMNIQFITTLVTALAIAGFLIRSNSAMHKRFAVQDARLDAKFEALRSEMVGSLQSLRTELSGRFDGIERRFEGLERRFDEMDSRLRVVEQGVVALQAVRAI